MSGGVVVTPLFVHLPSGFVNIISCRKTKEAIMAEVELYKKNVPYMEKKGRKGKDRD